VTSERPQILAIVGATGTGKSDLSLAVANTLVETGRPAEIVNADAMQLYRGMDIATAKLPPAQRQGIPHHLIDVLDVTHEAAVADFQHDARRVIGEILAREATPILVGGSGLYVSSVLFDFEFPGHDDEVRSRLESEMHERGSGAMFARLKDRAPEVAKRIDQKNERRIIRALEVLEITGDTAQLGTLPETPSYWAPTKIVALDEDRATLVNRLDARVTHMWDSGLLDEVRDLIPLGIEDGVTARRAIGYAQALAQLHGSMSQAEAIEQTQALTRRYARRQVSWFRRYADASWMPAGDPLNASRIVSEL
jgi:tRNA dimethylallyltransferase